MIVDGSGGPMKWSVIVLSYCERGLVRVNESNADGEGCQSDNRDRFGDTIK